LRRKREGKAEAAKINTPALKIQAPITSVNVWSGVCTGNPKCPLIIGIDRMPFQSERPAVLSIHISGHIIQPILQMLRRGYRFRR
jgi:hypothetical protein